MRRELLVYVYLTLFLLLFQFRRFLENMFQFIVAYSNVFFTKGEEYSLVFSAVLLKCPMTLHDLFSKGFQQNMLKSKSLLSIYHSQCVTSWFQLY